MQLRGVGGGDRKVTFSFMGKETLVAFHLPKRNLLNISDTQLQTGVIS